MGKIIARKKRAHSNSGGKRVDSKLKNDISHRNGKHSTKMNANTYDEDENEPYVDSEDDNASKLSAVDSDETEEDSEEEKETSAEKRLRIAKAVLEDAQAKASLQAFGEVDAADLDESHLSERLLQDALEAKGRLMRKIANKYSYDKSLPMIFLKSHQLSVTSVVIDDAGKYFYSASKDASIIQWDLSTLRKVHRMVGGRKRSKSHPGHTDHVLSLAVSSSGEFLASGGRDKLVHLWTTSNCALHHTFRKHKNIVSGLVFRKNTNTLYSASYDLNIHIWNCDELGYVDSLIGHNDCISSMDALARERCLTAGGKDHTVILWKISDEKRMEFQHRLHGSIDCIRYLNDDMWVTGSDDGALSLWHTSRKKPVDIVQDAHGGNWVISVTSLHFTDLVASGSNDGSIKIWRVDESKKKLIFQCMIPCLGFVNNLAFSPDGKKLIAAIGQEHRLGRWSVDKSVRNGIAVFDLTVTG